MDYSHIHRINNHGTNLFPVSVKIAQKSDDIRLIVLYRDINHVARLQQRQIGRVVKIYKEGSLESKWIKDKIKKDPSFLKEAKRRGGKVR